MSRGHKINQRHPQTARRNQFHPTLIRVIQNRQDIISVIQHESLLSTSRHLLLTSTKPLRHTRINTHTLSTHPTTPYATRKLDSGHHRHTTAVSARPEVREHNHGNYPLIVLLWGVRKCLHPEQRGLRTCFRGERPPSLELRKVCAHGI